MPSSDFSSTMQMTGIPIFHDSLTLVQAPWTRDTIDGIVLKTIHFQHKEYFQSNQFIAVLEIPDDSPHRLGFAYDSVRTKTSVLAGRHNAIAAINGSFFDMDKHNPICHLRIDSIDIGCNEPGKDTVNRKYYQYGTLVLHDGHPIILHTDSNRLWERTRLDLVSGDHFRGQLNVQAGDEVDYYLFAKDQSGRRERHPYIGAADPHHFSVEPLGIQSSIDEKVAAYPNPCTNWLVIQHAQGNLSTIRVTDIYGRIITEEVCNGDRTFLNTAHWTSGVYMVTITDQTERTCTKKIIKK